MGISAYQAGVTDKVVILTNIPSPYRIPFLRRLAALRSLHVVFDAKTESNRHWQVPEDLPFAHSYARGHTFRYQRRRSDGLAKEVRELHLRYGVLSELLRLRPTVVVSLEFGARSLLALSYCVLTGTPLVLWSEGTVHTEGWVGPVKTRVRRLLVRHANRFWVNGVESAELIKLYGGRSEQIDEGMTGVDTDWFAEQVTNQLSNREGLRKSLKVTGTCFLFVGQLTERKGLTELLQALALTHQKTAKFTVLLAGEGPLRAAVETWAAAHPECDLRLLGHLPPEGLVKMYVASDVFVLPTLDDNWSLATLEAAVAGLPQIFSRYNGAKAELIAQGVVGAVIDPFDADAFSAVLHSFVDDCPPRAEPRTVEGLVTYYSSGEFAHRAMRSITLCQDCAELPVRLVDSAWRVDDEGLAHGLGTGNVELVGEPAERVMTSK